MSFDSDLKALIREVDSSLHDLNNLLQESPQQTVDDLASSKCQMAQEALVAQSKVPTETLHMRMKEACWRASHFLKQMETVCSDNQVRLNELEEELTIQIESLERDAVGHFNRGEYQECLETMTFLSLLKPNDLRLRDYLELSQNKIEEGHNKLSSKRLDGTDLVPFDLTGLERAMRNGMGLDPSLTAPLTEDSALVPVSRDLEMEGLLDAKSSKVVPARIGLLDNELGPQGESQQPRFHFLRLKGLQRTGGLIALLALAPFLLGIIVGRKSTSVDRENVSGNFDPVSIRLAGREFGKTPVGLGTLEVGNHGASAMRDIDIPANQSTRRVRPTDQVSSEESAQALFDVGRLKDADRSCEAILKKDPRNKFALSLRKKVQDYYSHHADQTRSNARLVKTNRKYERDANQAVSPRTQQYPQQPEPHQLVVMPISSTEASHPQIERAFKDASVNQQSILISWVQKAESAMLSGRYILPPQDNALVHSRRALAIDPENEQALGLKRESFVKAVSQARELTQNGKYDEARHLYSSLYYLSQQENGFPFSVQELKEELDKLEFKAYPVVHQHLIGSCTGRLRINGYIVSFVPTGPPEDGFTERLANVDLTVSGDKLKLKVGDKSYNFRSNSGNDKEESRQSLQNINRQLNLLLAKVN